MNVRCLRVKTLRLDVGGGKELGEGVCAALRVSDVSIM